MEHKMKITYQGFPGSYIENDQHNPIRWTMLEEVEDKVFKNTTNRFRCRDYFNDFVAFNRGIPKFSTYGMDSDQGKVDKDGGFYILLTGCLSNLMQNLQEVINPELESVYGVGLATIPVNQEDITGFLVDKHDMIVYVPKELLKSTLRLSLITLFIRNCNQRHFVKSYENLLDDSFAADGQLREGVMNLLRTHNYLLEKEDKYIWYCSEKYNSVVSPHEVGMVIHDCGVGTYLAHVVGDDYDEEECEEEGCN